MQKNVVLSVGLVCQDQFSITFMTLIAAEQFPGGASHG